MTKGLSPSIAVITDFAIYREMKKGEEFLTEQSEKGYQNYLKHLTKQGA